MSLIRRSHLLGLAAASCLLTAPLVQAETPLGVSNAREAKEMYQHDTQACRSGAVTEDRKTCMLEAKRAYDQALREVGASKSSSRAKKSAAKASQ